MSIKLPRTIKSIRSMTAAEIKAEGWDYLLPSQLANIPVLVFDDGTTLYPAADSEGNGPGVLLGMKNNVAFRITPD